MELLITHNEILVPWSLFMGVDCSRVSFAWYLDHGKCFKVSNTFLFLLSNKMLVIGAGIHKKSCQNCEQGRP